MLVCTSVCYTFPFAYSVCVFCAFICDLTESARHCVCVIMLCVCFPVHLIVRSWMVAWSLVVKAVVCLVHLSCCTVCLSRQLSQLDSSRLPSNKQCSFRVTNSILYTVKDHYFIWRHNIMRFSLFSIWLILFHHFWNHLLQEYIYSKWYRSSITIKIVIHCAFERVLVSLYYNIKSCNYCLHFSLNIISFHNIQYKY